MKLVEMKRRLGSIPSDDRREILAEFEAHLVALQRRSRFEVCITSQGSRAMRDIPGAAKRKG
jgi:hypothetical protein